MRVMALPATNMAVLKPSRKKPRPGDLFVVNMRGKRWIAGRVIHLDCRMMSSEVGHEPLLYFYKVPVSNPQSLRPPFKPDLLIAPIITNFLGWKHGYFMTVGNWPFEEGERFARHWFVNSYYPLKWGDPQAVYCDEYGSDVGQPPAGYMGRGAGLCSYRAIDDHLSEAIGMPLAPESDVDRHPELEVPESRACVMLRVPSEPGVDLDVEAIEEPLIRAIEAGDAGTWEGHGIELQSGLLTITFTGSSAKAIVNALRPAATNLSLPKGSHFVVKSKGAAARRRIDL